MELLVLLSKNSRIIETVKTILKDYAIYPTDNVEELEDLLIKVSVDIFLVDTQSLKVSEIEKLFQTFGKDSIILIKHEGFDERKLEELPFCLEKHDLSEKLQPMVRIALDRKRCPQEFVKPYSEIDIQSLGHSLEPSERRDLSGGAYLHRYVLTNFAKTLTANFDISKLLNHFMDSLIEITRVHKISIMLRENNTFIIKAQRGIDPYLARSIRLDHKCLLVNSLARSGRIVHKPVSADNPTKRKISQELNLLQCTLSLPMIYKGRLEGIVNVGDKITGEPFYKDELEVIYTLCNYLSAAIKDFDLYHQIQSQKDFINNILSNMNSGVITIDRSEQICLFNKNASEILFIDPKDIIGKDLRQLPSPLGDILYETMVQGTCYKRHEVTVGAEKIQLGINSYRLKDKKNEVVGAGIIFTDLSELKKLEQEKRNAEKFKIMNIITGKIAHEIKNPLAAIQTFTQLLGEKYDDEEFRNYYATTVMQSIRKLNNLIDKIVLFSNPLNYMPTLGKVNEIIDEAVDAIKHEVPEDVHLFIKRLESPVLIHADRKLLFKGLYYLLTVCAEKLDRGGSIHLETNVVENECSYMEITIQCSGATILEKEMEEPLLSLLNMETLGVTLDMAIVQKIIEEHRGRLTVKQVNTGCQCVLSLPVVEGSSALQYQD